MEYQQKYETGLETRMMVYCSEDRIEELPIIELPKDLEREKKPSILEKINEE